MSRVFHYFSGEIVQPGDRVRISGRLGFVQEVMQPGSDNSLGHDFPDGGVLTITSWEGVQSPMVWHPPDGELWEDLEFIGRKDGTMPNTALEPTPTAP
jgi:hypothetical protein